MTTDYAEAEARMTPEDRHDLALLRGAGRAAKDYAGAWLDRAREGSPEHERRWRIVRLWAAEANLRDDELLTERLNARRVNGTSPSARALQDASEHVERAVARMVATAAGIGAPTRRQGVGSFGELVDSEPLVEAGELFADLADLDNAAAVLATVGVRTDGAALLYPGAVNVLTGDPEQGKSLIAAAVAVSVARRGGLVVWIDLDHNGARSFRGRVAALGGADVLDRFRFAEPDDAEGVLGAIAWAVEHLAELVVVDSMGELLPMFGASTDSADDYTRVHRQVLTPAARAGSCVLVIDHLAKGADSRAYGSTGTVAKKRAVDGAMYRVEAAQPFAPGTGGVATLRLVKDRHGSVREASGSGREPLAATFTMQPPGGDGVAAWDFRAPSGVAMSPERRAASQLDAAGVPHDAGQVRAWDAVAAWQDAQQLTKDDRATRDAVRKVQSERKAAADASRTRVQP